MIGRRSWPAFGETDTAQVWGFDSFKACRHPTRTITQLTEAIRLHRFPQLAVSIEEVIENFRRMGLWTEQIRLVKGRFKDTVPAAAVDKIAVLRLDGNLYESTIQVLEGFIRGSRRADFASSMILGPCSVAGGRSRITGGTTKWPEPIVNIDGKGVLWRKTFDHR